LDINKNNFILYKNTNMKKSLKYNKKTRKNIGGQLTDHQDLYCQQLNCYNETKKNGFGSCKRHPSTVFKSSEEYKPEICSDQDSVHNIVLGGLPKPKVKMDLSKKPNYNIDELEIGRRYNFIMKQPDIPPSQRGIEEYEVRAPRPELYNGKVRAVYKNDPLNPTVVLEDVIKNGQRHGGLHALTARIIEKITGENYTIDDIENVHPDITALINSHLGGRKSKKVTKRKRKSLKKTRKSRRKLRKSRRKLRKSH